MNYVEEIHQLVGTATTCWHKDGTFDEGAALKIASRLCDIVREAEAKQNEATMFLIQAFTGEMRNPRHKPRRRKSKE